MILADILAILLNKFDMMGVRMTQRLCDPRRADPPTEPVTRRELDGDLNFCLLGLRDRITLYGELGAQ